MPDTARSIVVSGGIEAAPPFTVGNIPLIVNVSPDVLSDSIMSQGAGPPAFIVIGTAPADATTEILQSTGTFYPSGGLADSLAIGRGCTVVGAIGGQMAIGFGVTIDALGNANNFNNLLVGGANTADDVGLSGMQGNTVVGFSNTVSDQASNNILIGNALTVSLANSNCVVIGNTNTLIGPSGNSLVAIGNGTGAASRSVAIGDRAGATAADSIAIGPESPGASGVQSIAIGRATRARGLDGICIGSLAQNINASDRSSIALGINSQTFQANQMVVGGIGTAEINELLIGAGNAPNQSPVFANLTIRTTNIPSAGIPDLSGASITIKTGTGIGNAAGGEFIVQVPDLQVSGLLVQPLVTGLQVQESQAALDTFLFIRDVDSGTLARVSVGLADSGGLGFKLLRIPN